MLLDLDPRAGEKKGCRLLVAGVGTAGCQAVTRWRETYSGIRDLPDTLAVHTDSSVLEVSRADRTFQLGATLNQGMGSGGDMKVGAFAVEEATDALAEVFSGYDLVFFLVGLGGGTGGGAAPALVRLARDMDVLTISMVTTPFVFEGDQRRRMADTALAQLKEQGDTVVVMPLQRLFESLPEDASVTHALTFAAERLTDGLRTLWRLLQEPGAMPLDLQDVRALATHSAGTCTFAHFRFSMALGPNEMAERIATSPLLEGGAVLTKAKGLLIGLHGGASLPLATVDGLLTQLGHHCARGAYTFWGVSASEPDGDELRVVVLVTEDWVPGSGAVVPDLVGDAVEDSPRDTAKGEEPLGQDELDLIPKDKGKFKDSDPTIINGEDLDIPTFVRKGIRLSG